METQEIVENTNAPQVEDVVETEPKQEMSLAKLKQLERELNSEKAARKKAEQEVEIRKRQELKTKEDYKTLADQLEKELLEEKRKNDVTWSWFENNKKMDTIKAIAASQGLRKDALSILENMELDGVEVEKTSTGRINVLGADAFVSGLKTKMPFLFESKTAKINAENPQVNSGNGPITYERLMQLKEEWRKSGDSAAYSDALRKYKQQL